MINALLNAYREYRYRRHTETDTAVLYALADDRQHHVYGDLHSTTGIRPGLLYPALSRLMGRGLVEDGWDEAPSARRWYQLTAAGRVEVAPRITPRTEVVADNVMLDWQTDSHGVERLAGVEVLYARGVEVDGLDVETDRPHGTGPEWTGPASPVPAHPGVARLLARCDELEKVTLNRHTHGGGLLPAMVSIAEVRALLAGGEPDA